MAFKIWIVLIECLTGKKLDVFRVDGGKKYLNNAWKTFMREHGIKWEVTFTYTPKQNGVAEHFWHTSISGVRVCLAQAKLPLSFWKLAVDYMVFTTNCMTLAHLAKNKQTGYQALHNHCSHLKEFHSFGCLVVVNIPKEVYANKLVLNR
jgi:transposase InsO family protein